MYLWLHLDPLGPMWIIQEAPDYSDLWCLNHSPVLLSHASASSHCQCVFRAMMKSPKSFGFPFFISTDILQAIFPVQQGFLHECLTLEICCLTNPNLIAMLCWSCFGLEMCVNQISMQCKSEHQLTHIAPFFNLAIPSDAQTKTPLLWSHTDLPLLLSAP